MCGAFNIIDSPFTHDLAAFFGTENVSQTGWQNCGQTISVVINPGGGNTLTPAIWWLLLERKAGQLKPSKYTTFNSRWREGTGFSRTSVGPFKHSRCIIPASGFIESQDKRYWHFEPREQAIAFGGLYQRWESDSGPVISCSIITTAAHPKMAPLHSKSMPLMLPLDQPAVLKQWLDPECTNTQQFEPLMAPTLRTDFKVSELQKWGALTPKPDSQPFTLSKDV